ncbi:GNAT family N-acetyltransferase, partial [Curvivirga aplysinae]|uniref:GNAT family N-acetyltransferase n=1 Tax=Curvivirga aplysinae TaxID=2529852 RepID=UPI0012BBA725
MPDGEAEFQISVHKSIAEIGREEWDKCVRQADDQNNPFICYDFLYSLEKTGCVCAETGWMPQHIKLMNIAGETIGVAPLYLKNHSQGEYVFDWGWADAYERAGGQYYPKLLAAIPFTPVTGPRLLVQDSPDRLKHIQALASGMIQLAARYQIATIHINFLPENDAKSLQELGFLLRNDMQFHWQNDDFTDFEDSLTDFVSRKRRSIKKERKKLVESGLTFKRLTGTEITQDAWDDFYRFYKDTYDRKWGAPYLNREFFDAIQEQMNDRILLVMAYDETNRAIAGALNLIGDKRLYGRNWGCDEQYKFLHFEACYYQAIEFAIERGLKFVEAGTQGQHKLQRGYMPTKTWSAHYIGDPGFKTAISNYLDHERDEIKRNIEILKE